MALDPQDLRQALARAPRQVLESNWRVAAPLDLQHFVVEYQNPAGIAPNLLATAADQFPGALIEWLSGPLSGVAPQTTPIDVQVDLLDTQGVISPATAPNASGVGRVISTVAQVVSTGSPVQTILEVADPLPVLPQTGDTFILYLPPQPTVQVNRGTVAIAGTVDATIVNAVIPITGDVTIAAGTVDATITQATIDLPITGAVAITAGTVDATITQATVNLPVTGTVEVTAGTVDIAQALVDLPITGAVSISAGTVDAAIIGATLDLPVTGAVEITGGQINATIAQAAIDVPVTGAVSISAGSVDATITQATVDLPITGAVSITAGTIDATITQASIDLPITGSVEIGQVAVNLPITGNVTVTAGTVDATITQATIDLPVTGSVTVAAGTVDATITNATLDLPVTGAVSITAGTVDANITASSLDLPITGSVRIGEVALNLPITGSVEITAGTVDATITQATIDLPITGAVEITAGTVDATITNATLDLPVTGAVSITAGTVDATITASSLDLPITGSVRIGEVALNLPITGAVEITAGTVDATITQATIDLPITGAVEITAGTVDATITNATLDLPITGAVQVSAGTVDATITNATLDLPITGAVEITAGTVDAAIVNATIDLPITGAVEITAGTVDVTGSVNATIVNATLDLPITGAVQVSAGTVDATIQNATIDLPVTGTTYLTNDQVGVGADYRTNFTVTVPANTSNTTTVNSSQIQVVTPPRMMSSSEAIIWLDSPNGYSYTVTITLYLGGLTVVSGVSLGTIAGNNAAYFIRFQDFTETAPLPYDTVQIGLTPSSTTSATDDVSVQLALIGTADSVTSSVYNPEFNTPCFLLPNTSGTLDTMANGVPLPVQEWDYDIWGGSGYHRPYRPVGGIDSYYTIGGNTSFTPAAGENFGTTYTLFSATGLSIPRVYQVVFYLAGVAAASTESYGQVTLTLEIVLSNGVTLYIPMFTTNFLNSADADPNGVQWVLNLSEGSFRYPITDLYILATDNVATSAQIYENQLFATLIYN